MYYVFICSYVIYSIYFFYFIHCGHLFMLGRRYFIQYNGCVCSIVWLSVTFFILIMEDLYIFPVFCYYKNTTVHIFVYFACVCEIFLREKFLEVELLGQRLYKLKFWSPDTSPKNYIYIFSTLAVVKMLLL